MRGIGYWRFAVVMAAAGLAFLIDHRVAAQPDAFQFVVLGDRTGEAQPGVYERVWREASAEQPAFVVSVGDTIEGFHDAAVVVATVTVVTVRQQMAMKMVQQLPPLKLPKKRQT